MAAPDLTHYVTDVERQIRDPRVTGAGSEAMAQRLSAAAAGYLGGDLSMSGAGPVTITAAARDTALVVETGGAYALADKGRRRAVPATAAAGTALRTPWGPRQSVAGSTWPGFGITDHHAAECFAAGTAAVIDNLEWGR